MVVPAPCQAMSRSSHGFQTGGSLENDFIGLGLMARVRLNCFGLIQSECEGFFAPTSPGAADGESGMDERALHAQPLQCDTADFQPTHRPLEKRREYIHPMFSKPFNCSMQIRRKSRDPTAVLFLRYVRLRATRAA